MSSGTLIKSEARPGELRPWQFFVLAALGCATAVTFVARTQGPTAVVLLSLMIGVMALVGIAALRTLNPFVTAEADRTVMIGQRTRAALEREKTLSLRAIKELEFDRAMGKVSDADFQEMAGRLRARAARLIKQLDAGGGYREQVEQELEKRLAGSALEKRVGSTKASPSDHNATASAERQCTCGTPNDADARFCKHCGARL